MQGFLDKIQLNDKYESYFEEAQLKDVKYYHDPKYVSLTLGVKQALPFAVYRDFIKKLKLFLKAEVSVQVASEFGQLDFMDVNQYVHHLAKTKHYPAIQEAQMQLNGTLTFLCQDENHAERVQEEAGSLQEDLAQLGLRYELVTRVGNHDFKEEAAVEMPAASFTRPVRHEESKKKSFFGRSRKGNYTPVSLSVLTEEAQNIEITGEIFEVDIRETRTGSFVVKYYLHDVDSAIVISAFVNEEKDILKKGVTIKARGNYIYEARYERDYIFKMDSYELMAPLFERDDESDEKRVEFHLHTNKSEMDGISDISEYLEQAFAWQHPGLIITDHTGVQSFPKAYGHLKRLRKAHPEQEFKLGYGVEMNMVDADLKIVRNAQGQPLHQGNYIVFDLETTGLSAYYDHIIEFGAVKIVDGKMVDTMQVFVKPPVAISQHIENLTNISNDMVKNAPTIETVLDDILAFIGDLPLVAHNASFDYDFLQETLRRLEREPLQNSIIDTLDLARVLFENRRSYRLGSIARLLRVTYDDGVAHRADYDAEVLSLVFFGMLRQAKVADMETIDELQTLSDKDGFAKVRKSHVNVIARNKEGLKHLYELISISHTQTLAFFGKTSGKRDEFMAEPRIIREELAKEREHLLIGAGCTNSELFEIAMNKSQKALESCIAFYDYVEIMPLEIYQPLLYTKTIPDEKRLLDILQRIIATAEQLNKPIIAVGDVHYNHPNDKVIRDVYIHAQGIGGTRHPLYMFREEMRLAFEAPNQHFRSTTEMLEAFAYVGAKAREYVITNPQKLLAEIEDISPKQDALYTPKLENSDDILTRIVYDNAHKLYGEPLPDLVAKRLERELNSIITHGYGVIYYISHLLVKRSLDAGYLVGSRGSVGSSLVATMAEITEVNPLPPHYICPECHYHEFFLKGEVSGGYDLTPKACPQCGTALVAEGQDIPFETFLGFEGDKVPDIDLNFSGDYQEFAHAYTKDIFGVDYVYRAGTISTVAQKTAYGYVLGYHESMKMEPTNNAYNTYLASKAEGVKRTTGQHPGGIIVIPRYMDVHDFTPIQYPANNPDSSWYTTHFEFHDIDDNVLKLDILGHVDPTAMKMLEKLTGVDVNTVPMNDAKTLSLFNSSQALEVDERYYQEITGAAGLPEFGTPFVRKMLEVTRPDKFSDLVRISGLSHGTDVWRNNADALIAQGMTLDEVIGCRDDIMTYLVQHDLESKEAFDIMESVRKGKGLKPEWVASMKKHDVPSWYIDSCEKIKYMFPKAHAVAYVMMAIRVAWFKVYYPLAYYAVYFSIRVNAHEIETMIAKRETVANRLNSINERLKNFETKKDVSIKEKNLLDTLEITLEMINRGYHVSPLDLETSHATEFILDPNDDKAILPPFTVVDGLGAAVANQIVKAREERMFISKKDLMSRGGISAKLVKKLDELQVTSNLQESNQMSLF